VSYRTDYIDVVAIHKHAGYTFFICLSGENGYNKFALVEQRSGLLWCYHHTIEECVNEASRFQNYYHAYHKGEYTDYCAYYIDENKNYHMPDLNPDGGIVTFDWRWGQECKFKSGEYKPLPKVPIINELGLEYPKDHYVHLSTTVTESDFVAYTPSESYGEQDRQVRMKYGKYLRKAFPDLSDANVQRAVNEFRAALLLESKPAELHFTTEKSKITEIFETRMYACNSSAESCMWDKFTNWNKNERPYHVYADSPDVALAYVTERGQIIARSVVSTKDKKWIRLYSNLSCDSTVCAMMEGMLKDAGYTYGSITGNRLSIVGDSDGDEVIAPYIDCGDVGLRLAPSGKYWIACDEDDCDYIANQTNGYASRSDNNECDRCGYDNEDCHCIYCDCCEEYYAEGCDICSTCENCDDCETHGNCECERCESCENVLERRRGRNYVEVCDCERCEHCNALVDDCDCEKCDECMDLLTECECERCDECKELASECECEPEEETEEIEEAPCYKTQTC
jgi:hypothetical protein